MAGSDYCSGCASMASDIQPGEASRRTKRSEARGCATRPRLNFCNADSSAR